MRRILPLIVGLVALTLAGRVGIAQASPDPAPEAVAEPSPAPLVDEFPEPKGIRSAVSFWQRVYLEVTTQAGLLHDARHLGVVYEAVRFGDETNSRRRQRLVESRRSHWRNVLRSLASGRQPQTAEEETVLRLLELELGHEPKGSDLRRASDQIRFQLGQRNKFREGIIRSGAYEQVMRAIFRQEGLPEDLTYLPHVESSFNLKAYSKYGAAGIWQFMRSTGHRFMRIDYTVDERLDPIQATRAAARLLKENYDALQSWPLAITAYNHGVAGMQRAKRATGTDDITVIIRDYNSRTFGFASRNFYVQFLAARKVMQSWESFFGPLERDDPEVVDEIVLPHYVDVRDLHKYLGVAPEVVQSHNLALRQPVFVSGKRIPAGYTLRLPAGTTGGDPEAWLAQLPGQRQFAEQKRSSYYTVHRGDTLSSIASRHGTSVSRLVAINNLPSRHRIYPGQTLQLPDVGGSSVARPEKDSGFSLVKAAQAKPAPPVEPQPEQKIEAVVTPPQPKDETSPFRRIENERVTVDALETLAHFAEWLEIPVSRLRQLNGFSGRRELHFGQRLKLDFSKVGAAIFAQRRAEYHKGIEEDFFSSYRVTGTINHKLKRGDTLWELSHRTYRVPAWLIQSYNQEQDLTRLRPGEILRIPVVEPAGS